LDKDEEVAEKKNPVETEKDKEKAKKADEFKAAKRARRKHRKVAKMEAKLLTGAGAAKNNEQDEQGGQESDPETPESSEPATEADAVEDVVCKSSIIPGRVTQLMTIDLGMKRKPSFGDVSIKLVNGVGRVGVHSASDDEEDESGEEVV
jgi:hypothetical protein